MTGHLRLWVFFACGLLVAACCSSADAGVLAYWDFEDGSGGTATDVSGNGWNGTLTDFIDTSANAGQYEGGSGWADGALNYDGRSLDNVLLIDTVRTELPIASMSGQSFTIEAVLSYNWPQQNWSPFFGQSDDVCCPHIFFFGKTSGAETLHHNISGFGSANSAIVPISDGNPHHVALAFDDNADTIDVYFDHVNVTHVDGVTGTLDTFDPNVLWLGGVGHNAEERWNGFVYDARVTVDDVPGDGAGVLGPGDFLPIPTPGPPPGPLGSTFSFADFSDASMVNFRGTAGPFNDRLRLTSVTGGSHAGVAVLDGTVQLLSDYTFQTEFSFELTDPIAGDPPGADGFAFVIHDDADGPNAIGAAGGGQGMDTMDPALVVDFDTWATGTYDVDGMPKMHLDINTSAAGNLNWVALPVFNDGGVKRARVEYDGDSQMLDVYMWNDGDPMPGSPTLSTAVDLAGLFGGNTDLVVGFTAGTGGALNNHDIVSWEFQSVPEPSTLVLAAMALLGLLGYGWRRRK